MQAVLREVEMLSRRDYTLKVSMTWEQADGGAAAVMASMEFQVGYRAFRVVSLSVVLLLLLLVVVDVY